MILCDSALLSHHTMFEFHGGGPGHAEHIPPYQILLAWRGGSGGGMDPERGMLGQCSSSAGPYPLHAPPWVIWYSAVGRARENRLPGCIPAHHW